MLWLKLWSMRGASHNSVFMGSCQAISHYPVDEFSFKEMMTWGQSKITFYCISVLCE